MIQIRVDVGDSLNRLLTVQNGLQHSKRLYTALGETLRTIHKKRFEQEQRSPDGQAWQALSPHYARHKRGEKILVGQGYLKNTLRYNVTSHHVEFGSDRPYARLHQYGGTIRPKNARVLKLGNYGYAKQITIPARAWLGLNDNNRELLLQKTEHYLQSLLGG